MEYTMHRAIKISTGEVLEVSDVLANDPNLLLQYGFMLQPLPEEDITEELNAKFSQSEQLTATVPHIQEGTPLETPEFIEAATKIQEAIVNSKPKVKQNK